jgi:integrase
VERFRATELRASDWVRRRPSSPRFATVSRPATDRVEETPTKSATLDDIRALDAGCAGDQQLNLRDRAIVLILKTTAARNSGVRLLRLEDIDFERALIRFRRGNSGKTLDVAL